MSLTTRRFPEATRTGGGGFGFSHSQEQTEGRVNKLKLVKRSMYGRGKFDLLCQRTKVL
jgi:hypothetical protein